MSRPRALPIQEGDPMAPNPAEVALEERMTGEQPAAQPTASEPRKLRRRSEYKIVGVRKDSGEEVIYAGGKSRKAAMTLVTQPYNLYKTFLRDISVVQVKTIWTDHDEC